jgi:hypothetical protein
MRITKFFSAFALVAALCIDTISATPTTPFDVIIGSAMTSVTVNLTNISKQNVTVQITNNDNRIVVLETLKKEKDGIKTYNMEKMEDGVYNLVVSKKGSRVKQPFSIQRGQVVLSETDRKETFFPVFRLNKDKLDVNAFTGAYGTITVKVSDVEGNSVYSDKNKNVYMLHKRYSVKDLPNGTYRAEIVMGDESFYYLFTK